MTEKFIEYFPYYLLIGIISFSVSIFEDKYKAILIWIIVLLVFILKTLNENKK